MDGSVRRLIQSASLSYFRAISYSCSPYKWLEMIKYLRSNEMLMWNELNIVPKLTTTYCSIFVGHENDFYNNPEWVWVKLWPILQRTIIQWKIMNLIRRKLNEFHWWMINKIRFVKTAMPWPWIKYTIHSVYLFYLE